MITTLTEENFETIVAQKEKPLIIDVFATWCGPCTQMEPIFEKLSNELSSKYNFAKLNVDENRELATKFNVTLVPTFLILKNGEIVGRESGYLPEEDFRKKIEEILKK